MADLSQSHFLQSLGWATLNSFWQMAMLWCIYLGITSVRRFSAHQKYQLAVGAVFTGFAWFCITLAIYYFSTGAAAVLRRSTDAGSSGDFLSMLLVAASFAYLALLVFPSLRLFRNWQFVKRIRREGIEKAHLEYRLFVQKISAQLGITRKVMVYVSHLVVSPVTVGYLKPVILLPVAALNNLSMQQAEAILLHELSHIRRYDYLVNLAISIINTILYFNPFVKQFMKAIEAEREACCDDLVLQYGYDKVGYASALLTLEKVSASRNIFAIAATGRNNLLSRIEKIVGMEKKKKFSFNQFAAVLAALLCILAFNSVLIMKEEKKATYSIAYNNFANPFTVFNSTDAAEDHSVTPVKQDVKTLMAVTETPGKAPVTGTQPEPAPLMLWPVTNPEPAPEFIQVAGDVTEMALTSEEKAQVKKTVDAARKVVSTLQWKEIDNSIADAMNRQEKEMAKQQYLKALEKNVDWKNIEQNLKAKYDDVNWNYVNNNLDQALTAIQLDSIQKCYKQMLLELKKTHAAATSTAKVKSCETAIPDVSVQEISQAQKEIETQLQTIRNYTTPKKVVRL
ncbi:MAG TPA: M56 family metallopeptidase [Flavisolibacter sp.]